MSASSKRQTMAKMTRERALKERRAIKQEKKDDKKRRAELGLPPDEEGTPELTGDVVALNLPI
jgi:hypothetical protein